MKSWAAVATSLAFLFVAVSATLFEERYYISKDPRAATWWHVMPGDVATIKADATTLNSTLLPPTDFANTFVAAVGRGQGPQVARALAFLINGNMTYGGGCPAARTTAENSKMLAALLQTVKLAHNSSALLSGGRGVPQQAVADVDPANLQDGQVEDAILGALFMAARPCGPPNRLSSPSMEVVEDKYLNSTCYYVGPILTALIPSAPAQSTNDIEFPQWFTTAEQQATATDNWVAGSMMRAFVRCRRGGAAAQAPPAWLNRSFPASSLQAARVAQPVAATSQQSLITTGGRRLLA